MKMTLQQFRDYIREKKLGAIRPLQNCPECSSGDLRSVQVEPLDGRSTLDVTRSCIVECGGCDTKYVSRYD